jgi:hypothetical protein
LFALSAGDPAIVAPRSTAVKRENSGGGLASIADFAAEAIICI